MGEGRKGYYITYSPEKIPIDVFGLWTIVRDTLDPGNESRNLGKILEDTENESKRED